MLKVDKPTDVDITGYGLSPEFTGELIDEGDYYTWLKPTITSVALTKSPRSGIIYEKANNGDENMGLDPQEIIEKKDNQILSQQDEIAILKKQLKDAQKEAKAKSDLEKELETVKSKFEEAQKSAEEYKEDAKIFREHQQAKKEDIIKSLAGDDEEGIEKFKDIPLETLEYMAEKSVRNKPHEPLQSTNPNEGDEGSEKPEEEKSDDELTFEELNEKYQGVL